LKRGKPNLKILMRTKHLIALLAAAAIPAIADAQSLLDRPANMSGDWSGASGTLYFHFVHRFAASSAPERKVSNVPTFLLAAGLPKRVLAGFNYSTNSTLAPRFPNEWELFARWMPLSEDYGSPFDVGAQIGYNNAADGVDGELSLGKRLGRVRLLAAGRALSRIALAGGATFRLTQFLALAGDLASMIDRDSAERVAWSAGVHFAIPLTPHTVSIHATNAMLTTLQGASRGSQDVRYGFEFTIPLTLRRYFGRRAAVDTPSTVVAINEPRVDSVVTTPPVVDTTRVVAALPPSPAPSPAPPPARTTPAPAPASPKPVAPKPAAPRPQARVVRTSIKNVNYLQPRLQVTVGTTIEWTNNDPMPHTVTATDKSFDSGLIDPGKTYRHTFTKAGTFNFFCQPHPFMKGTVVVRQP
jgi:plastocyanin